MLFSTQILLLLIYLAVFTTSKPLPKQKRDGFQCKTVDSISTDALQWHHLTQPTLSIMTNSTDPMSEDLFFFSEVRHTFQVPNESYNRSIVAQYNQINGFSIAEYWQQNHNPQVTLSETYYALTFTDKEGHDPVNPTYVYMPADASVEPYKACGLDIINDASHRYFTLNVYTKAL